MPVGIFLGGVIRVMRMQLLFKFILVFFSLVLSFSVKAELLVSYDCKSTIIEFYDNKRIDYMVHKGKKSFLSEAKVLNVLRNTKRLSEVEGLPYPASKDDIPPNYVFRTVEKTYLKKHHKTYKKLYIPINGPMYVQYAVMDSRNQMLSSGGKYKDFCSKQTFFKSE
jgi:hypothetical protein